MFRPIAGLRVFGMGAETNRQTRLELTRPGLARLRDPVGQRGGWAKADSELAHRIARLTRAGIDVTAPHRLTNPERSQAPKLDAAVLL
jgi:hypothetical protein